MDLAQSPSAKFWFDVNYDLPWKWNKEMQLRLEKAFLSYLPLKNTGLLNTVFH